MNTGMKLFFTVVLSAACIGFTSCSDDKEEDVAGAIAGTYTGNLTLADQVVAQNTQIGIAKASSKTQVTLTMNETVAMLPINIKCTSAVTLLNGTYSFAGSTTFDMPAGESTIPVPVTLNGTIDKSGNAVININVAVPDAPVAVVYKGSRQ
jgi:hypothetical protein